MLSQFASTFKQMWTECEHHGSVMALCVVPGWNLGIRTALRLKRLCSILQSFRQLRAYSQKRPQLPKLNTNVHFSDHYVHTEAGRSSSVGVVTGIQIEEPRNCASIPGMGKLSSFKKRPDCLRGPSTLLFERYRRRFTGVKRTDR